MTDIPEHVVIPYARFLEILERRRRFDHQPGPQPPKTDADLPPVPHHPPEPESRVWRAP